MHLFMIQPTIVSQVHSDERGLLLNQVQSIHLVFHFEKRCCIEVSGSRVPSLGTRGGALQKNGIEAELSYGRPGLVGPFACIPAQ